jgi:hypothetical protein
MMRALETLLIAIGALLLLLLLLGLLGLVAKEVRWIVSIWSSSDSEDRRP